MYCWSDLNGRLRRHRRASPSTVKKKSIENTEKYTENNKQHHENKITASWEQKTKYKNTRKIKKENAKNLTYREENKEAMRQTQRERYKREKIK